MTSPEIILTYDTKNFFNFSGLRFMVKCFEAIIYSPRFMYNVDYLLLWEVFVGEKILLKNFFLVFVCKNMKMLCDNGIKKAIIFYLFR